MASQYIKYPKAIPTYATAANFPPSASDGDLAIALDSHDLYEYEVGVGWVAIAGPGIGGSVTSVALSAPVEFTVSGSPVTTAGTLTLTKANQNANLVYAGPASGGAAQPTFRSLVTADLPVGVGDVVGPSGATDNALVRFDGTTGKLIQDSSSSLSDAGALALPLATVSLPAYSFSGDPDTGIWSSAANTLDFATAGVNRWSMNSTTLSSGSATTANILLGASNLSALSSGLTLAGPTGASLLINNSGTYVLSGNALRWVNDNMSFADLGRFAISGLITWGRPQAIYTRYRLQVNSSDKATNEPQNPGALFVKNVAAHAFGVLSSTNASTTIVGAAQNDGILRNLAVGDYVQLSGLSTYGKILTITDNTTFTVDTPLGDGTSRQIVLTTPMAVFEADGIGEAIRLQYTGEAQFHFDVSIDTAGKGLRVAGGSNARIGTQALNGSGSNTVSNTSVTSNTRIFLTSQSQGGTTVLAPRVNNIIPGVSFDITYTIGDTSTVAWFMVEQL